MQFTKYDLGQLDKGRVVEIILKGNAANVRLMDSSNFNNYRNGRNHRYIGGLAKKSPLDCRRRTQRIGMLQSIWRGWVEEFKVQFGFYQHRYRK